MICLLKNYQLLCWWKQILLKTDWLSQVPTSTVRSPATDSDPGTFLLAHHIACVISGFRDMKPLVFVQHGIFRSPIPSLALWLTSSFPPASCGTLPFLHAEFRTERVVTLYSDWIIQLVDAGFAWRTHSISYALQGKKHENNF